MNNCLLICTPSRALLATLQRTMEVVGGGIMLRRASKGSLLLCFFDGGLWLLFSHRGFLPVVNYEPNLHKIVYAAAPRGIPDSNSLSFFTTMCCYGFGHYYRDVGGVLR